MKNLLLYIENSHHMAELHVLLVHLKDTDLAVVVLPHIPDTKDPDGLLITDSDKAVRRAKQLDMACIGYEAPDNKTTLFGCDIVVQGFHEIYPPFLELIWRRHHHLPWHIRETKRLIIRESTVDDAPHLHQLTREPGLARDIGEIQPTLEATREHLECYINTMYPFYGYGLWTILERSTGAVIGRAGLQNSMFEGKSVVDLGYYIGLPYRRQGYALETCKAIIDYGFSTLEADSLYTFIREGNLASLSLSQKLGFKKIDGIKVENSGETTYNLISILHRKDER